MLQKLTFRPGINRELTSYTNEGGWWDGDKIRFRQGYPETIGGWSKFTDTTYLGSARSITTWGDLTGETHIGLGTHLKYYIVLGSMLYDITPLRATTAAGDVTFAATNGSSTLTVTDTTHNATLGDYVTFSGAASLGGQVVAGELNKEFAITSIVDSDNYTVEASVVADGSDTGNGGASVIGAYQINVGLDNAVAGVGWGSDPWSDGGWGDAGILGIGIIGIRIWSADNFGEDLIMNPRGGGIYYWDRSVGTGTRAVNISALSGASDTPQYCNMVMVSDQDRHVIAFGTDTEENPGTQDPLIIRWSDQENAADWTNRTTNTAGELRLSSGSEIVTAIQTKREIVIFTDASLYSMQFLGPPYTFGVNEMATNIQILSQNAAVSVNDAVYWMASGKFMIYDGTARELECDLRDYVFDNMNVDQIAKVTAGVNSQFSEIWWFYPTTGSENTRYVIYNYADQIWYHGSMERTAWLDRSALSNPIAASTDGYLYSHEDGMNDGSVNPAIGIDAFIESSQQDLGDGDNYFFATRVIPDITFRNSTGTPNATFTIQAREFPGGNYNTNDAGTVTQTASAPVEQFTNQFFIRLRGRSFTLKIESNELNTQWRMGSPRIEVRTDGRR